MTLRERWTRAVSDARPYDDPRLWDVAVEYRAFDTCGFPWRLSVLIDGVPYSCACHDNPSDDYLLAVASIFWKGTK